MYQYDGVADTRKGTVTSADLLCATPGLGSAVTGDCDDADPTAFPGAPEALADINTTPLIDVLLVLLMSGLQIFNAHPALYWGDRSDRDRPLLSMQSVQTEEGLINSRFRSDMCS